MEEMIFKKILKNEKLFDRAVKKFIDSRCIEEMRSSALKVIFTMRSRRFPGRAIALSRCAWREN